MQRPSRPSSDVGLVRVPLVQLGAGALGGRAEVGRVVGEHVECQAGFLDRGVPAADRLQALVEHVLQQVAFRLQRLVESAVETGLVGVGLPGALPHLGQEDLERRGQGRAGVGQQVVGDDLGQAVLDREPVLPLEPARPRGAADRLDDPAAVERLQEHLGPGKLRLGQPPVDLRQPLLAEPQHQLAPRPGLAVAQRGHQRRHELVQLARLGRVGTGEDLLDLVQEDDQGFAEPRLLGTPGLVQGGLLVRNCKASRSDPDRPFC